MESRVRCMVAAQKVVTYACYILIDVPTPNRDMQAFYERKPGTSYGEVGREEMSRIGFPTRRSFVEAVSAEVYGHLSDNAQMMDGRKLADGDIPASQSAQADDRFQVYRLWPFWKGSAVLLPENRRTENLKNCTWRFPIF